MIHDGAIKVRNRAWVKMKLGAVYNFWDGEENLAESVEAIRAHVDFLAVVWSKKSVYGEKRTADDSIKIAKIFKTLKFAEVVRFEPLATAEKGDMQKRNQAIDLCKVFECTHLMSIDPDEVFKPDQFAMVKAETAEYDYATTTAPVDREQFGGKIFRMPEFVPMIYRLDPNRRFRFGVDFPVLTSRSRRIETHNRHKRRNYMADEVLILNRQGNRTTQADYERSTRNSFYTMGS